MAGLKDALSVGVTAGQMAVHSVDSLVVDLVGLMESLMESSTVDDWAVQWGY